MYNIRNSLVNSLILEDLGKKVIELARYYVNKLEYFSVKLGENSVTKKL